ncbi:4'-phosphopantetheinyl transferase EntD (siderophore biosynthesis) [Streptomyces sp. DvalAA-14]|uniref:4'-phosphopantetheinyl transferase family protein n=1 Tax=unclassified Streptomyces TaxID=2593676 RepID=UPI00081B8CA0|nr:4'-phosphopantetheinyl transferase superfamily protein [Streptomyces sp. DvalAA-14]MYS25239.1 4'-phosphopantetheinyl transferase superfamily protein [Streptomyces sp. SID4948]SCE53165.1 4'-phosphopantetheinyl transferase EntD (siderophore biosynthesis) [Streptomyces sp. DvalAA-14]
MIEHVVPATVRSRVVYGDALDQAPLYPQEAEAVARAVAKRRGEYAAGRACARAALAELGHPPGPILREAERGAPVWPAGVVGSITHTDGYRAAAVARTEDVLTLGIDAEPHGPLPEGVLDVILATPAERAALDGHTARRPGIHWDRLLFSAKETVYKAWYPFHRRMLGFTEAELLFDQDAGQDAGQGADRDMGQDIGQGAGAGGRTGARGTYTARLLIPGPLLAEGVGPSVFTGRWIVRGGYVATAVVVPNEPSRPVRPTPGAPASS